MEFKDVISIIISFITGGAAVVLAVITWRYVRFTRNYVKLTKEILDENRRMRFDAQKPLMAIHLRSETTNQTTVFLCVSNIGVGPAYHIKFDTDLSFQISGGRPLSEVRFFSSGINYMPPGEKREQSVGHGSHNDFDKFMQSSLNISVSYKDSMDELYEESFCLDFREH